MDCFQDKKHVQFDKLNGKIGQLEQALKDQSLQMKKVWKRLAMIDTWERDHMVSLYGNRQDMKKLAKAVGVDLGYEVECTTHETRTKDTAMNPTQAECTQFITNDDFREMTDEFPTLQRMLVNGLNRVLNRHPAFLLSVNPPQRHKHYDGEPGPVKIRTEVAICVDRKPVYGVTMKGKYVAYDGGVSMIRRRIPREYFEQELKRLGWSDRFIKEIEEMRCTIEYNHREYVKKHAIEDDELSLD